MELFGILFSVPVALVLSRTYCAVAARHMRTRDHVRRLLHVMSLMLLGLFLVEMVLLVTLGAVSSRALLGPSFAIAHTACFFLGTPALANVLLLGRSERSVKRWRLAAVICTGFAVFLVLLQYVVSEALYGLNGTEGPFS